MEFFHTRSLLFLRISLGVVFVWLGILKLFSVSPDIEIIQKAFPSLAHFQLFTFLIALIEIAIGAGYLSNRLTKITSLVMIFTLIIISIPVFISQGLDPRFPVLSLIGEYVLKNLALISGGLVLLSDFTKQQTKEEKLTKQSQT